MLQQTMDDNSLTNTHLHSPTLTCTHSALQGFTVDSRSAGNFKFQFRFKFKAFVGKRNATKCTHSLTYSLTIAYDAHTPPAQGQSVS